MISIWVIEKVTSKTVENCQLLKFTFSLPENCGMNLLQKQNLLQHVLAILA